MRQNSFNSRFCRGCPSNPSRTARSSRHRRRLRPPWIAPPDMLRTLVTCRSRTACLAEFIDVLLSPVASTIRRPDPTPSLQPRYEPSSLLRVGPSQRPASVLSPHGLLRLCFSLCIGAGSCGSTVTPASASRPLNAGRRSPSHQASGELIQEDDTPLVLTTLSTSRRFIGGFAFARLSDAYLFKVLPELCLQRSRPRLLNAAAWSGLRPAPESRSRGAIPHHHRSFSAQNIRPCRSSFLRASAAHCRRRAGARPP